MPVVIFKDGKVGMQKQSAAMEGVWYSVVNDSIARYYTKYGFVIPLCRSELDYEAMVENRLPFIPSEYEDCSSATHWVLIDHHGVAWQIDYFTDRERADFNRKKMSYFSIPTKGVDTVVCPEEGDKEMIVGFLLGCNDIEKLNAYIFEKKLGRGCQMHWFDVDNIVKELNTRFPLQKQ